MIIAPLPRDPRLPPFQHDSGLELANEGGLEVGKDEGDVFPCYGELLGEFLIHSTLSG